MFDVTRLLDAAAAGDPRASADLLPLVDDELRKLTAARMAAEPSDQTLQPTALVHEAYLRLIAPAEQRGWDNRGHFFAAAAEAMRRIFVENARRKKRLKHGGDRQRVDLESIEPSLTEPSESLLELDEAVSRLAAHDPIKAEVVKLRYFAGLTMSEVAQALRLSLATAERHWAYARAWLYADLSDDSRDEQKKTRRAEGVFPYPSHCW